METAKPGREARGPTASQDSASSASPEFAAVYDELRALAAASLRKGSSPTLQPTALVHEAWLKLDGKLGALRDRGHFFALAGLAMRQILADRARAARTRRRDARRVTVTLDPTDDGGNFAPLDLIALDDALTKLAALKQRHARVVELRFLVGLTIEQTSTALGVASSTVEADWAMARTWLRRELQAS